MYLFSELKKQDINIDYLLLLSQLTSVNLDNLNIDDIELFIKNLNKNHKIFLLKDEEKNNKIIGTITIIIEKKITHNFNCVGHIEDVIIDKNYRGKKLGKRIINEAVNYCRNINCYKVILDCSDNNIKFYEKCNFTLKGNQMALYFD